MFIHDMAKSSTLYIGNLSFYTTEEQLHQFFSKCGALKRIVMGLDRHRKTPAGFASSSTRPGLKRCKLKSCLTAWNWMNGSLCRSRSGVQGWETVRAGSVRWTSSGRVPQGDYDAGRGGWVGLPRRNLISSVNPSSVQITNKMERI